MSEFAKIIEQMNPNVYQRLKNAVELGKWPDGRPLTEEQRETSLQAVIAYEVDRNFPEHERTGYIEGSCASQKQAVSTDFAYKVGN